MIRLANLREAAARARTTGTRLGGSVNRWRIIDFISIGLAGVIPFFPWFAVAFVALRIWISCRVHASHTRRAISITIAAQSDGMYRECEYWTAALTECDPALARWIDDEYAKVTVHEGR